MSSVSLSSRLCERVIENLGDGVITADNDGIILSYNPASERLFGYSADDVIGRSFSTLFDGVFGDHDLCSLAAEHTPTKTLEISGRHKNGRVIPLELSIIKFELDKRDLYLCTVRDGSGRNKIRADHEVLIEKLTESNAEFERFAYVASHDMQEPLRAMSSFSEIISSEYASVLDDEGKLYLKLIKDAASRMQTMVVDLLEYARVGKEQAPFVLFDAQEQFSHVLDNLATSIVKRHATITTDKLPDLTGNPVQFLRLLQNLIGNSLKYCAPEIKPTIHVSAEDQSSVWQVSVLDNGIGIDEKNSAKIFEPFKRLHNRDKYAGTGLGLSVCKKIVENHGGKIWCEPVLDGGSRFVFTWPKGVNS